EFEFGHFTRNAKPALAMREKKCRLMIFSRRFTRSPRSSPGSRGTCASERKQSPLDDHQVGQREEAEHPRAVLRQPLVADLLVTEQVLHDVEGMLDQRADLCLLALDEYRHLLKHALRHRLDRSALGRDQPLDLRTDATFGLCSHDLGPLVDAAVARIRMD